MSAGAAFIDTSFGRKSEEKCGGLGVHQIRERYFIVMHVRAP